MPAELDYYHHLLDSDVAENEIENHIGEGWTAKTYYEYLLEDGMVQPI